MVWADQQVGVDVMYADLKAPAAPKAAPKAAPPVKTSEDAVASVSAAESAAAALEREMEDAEDVFGDEDDGGDAGAADSPPAARQESAVEQLATAQRETSEKESQVRQSLAEQQRKVKEEASRLALFESELKKLKVQEAADVGMLRTKLEDTDRDLVWLERDFKMKEAAYVKAKEAFEAAQARKRTMHEHLALMVLSSEKRKEEKLNELISRMNEKPEDGPTDAQLLG